MVYYNGATAVLLARQREQNGQTETEARKKAVIIIGSFIGVIALFVLYRKYGDRALSSMRSMTRKSNMIPSAPIGSGSLRPYV